MFRLVLPEGGHSHINQSEFLIAVAGSFDLILDDGERRISYNLNRPDFGILVPKGYWRELENFSSSGVCLVIASGEFDEKDYIRDYNDFIDQTSSN